MLKLIKLNVENFGVFDGNRSFTFENGINIIRGINGKGKSTIVNAIEMLLFDNYCDSMETFINSENDSFTICLDFEIDKVIYSEELKCKKTKSVTSTRTLTADGKSVASGEAVKSYLASIIPPEVGKYALTVKQRDSDSITKCKDNERRELFKRVKELNFEKEIREHLIPKLDGVKADILQVEREIYHLENYHYPEIVIPHINEYGKDVYDKKCNLLNDLISRKAVSDSSRKLYNSMITELSELEHELSMTNIEVQQTETRIAETTTCIEKIRTDMNDVSYKDNLINSLINERDGKIERLCENHSILVREKNNTLSNDEKELASLQNEMSNLKLVKLMKFNDDELQKCNNDYTVSLTEKNNAEKNARLLASGVCPTCGQNCNGKHEDYLELAKNLENDCLEYRRQIQSLNEKKTAYENGRTENERKKNVRERLGAKIESLIVKIAECEKDIEERNNSMTDKKNEIIEEYNKRISDVDKTVSERNGLLQNNLEREMNSLELMNSHIKSFLEKITYIEEKITNKKKEISEHSVSEDISEDEITMLRNELKDWEKNEHLYSEYKDAVAEDKALRDKNESELKTLKEKKLSLETCRKNIEDAKIILTSDFPNWVIDGSVSSIEQNMNDFIESVYYKSLSISLKSGKSTIKLEFGNGKRKLPCSKLSGAEQKLTDISFIHSFNNVLGLSCLILDEPDSALDDKRKEELYSMLMNMKDVYDQMLIITHSEKMINHITANSECNMIIL